MSLRNSAANWNHKWKEEATPVRLVWTVSPFLYPSSLVEGNGLREVRGLRGKGKEVGLIKPINFRSLLCDTGYSILKGSSG